MLFISLFSPLPLFSQWAILMNDADSLVLEGTDNIYNLEFEKAKEKFEIIKERYPKHPAGYFLDAMIVWWKINLDQDNEEFDNEFNKKVEKVINVCDETLDTNNYNITALFFKGGVIGYRARLRIIRNDWFDALKDAETALDILQKCQQVAPFNHDIMLGTGLYNYFSEKFPQEYPLLKPLMVFLPKGDKRLGLFQLRASAKYARYASTESKVALMQIYYSFENSTYDALQIAQELNSKYPDNPYFQRYLGRCYIRMGMNDAADVVWRDVLKKTFTRKRGYNNLVARESMYYVGVNLMYDQKYKEALKFLKKSVEGSEVIDKKTSGFKISALLKIGNIYDKLGDRKTALKYYNKVLEQDEWNNSHQTAKKYIKTPY
ncbi:MAG: hypothetical protein A2X64_02360 [Ignavibacteria bacterium GWF2_33_9]|nr:MAG: hypothetical protein A2X64_02360 [Ignavibacteria bacterium GWF2_33_9]